MLLVPATLLAQDRETPVEIGGIGSISEAARVAEEIVKASGKKANFLIAEAAVPNAVAVLRQGKRYILYNPRFMKALTIATGTKWAAVSVLAHEIGHHLYGNPSENGNTKLATELQADEFSGYVLEKLGATLPEAQAAMSILATSTASLTHPARAERVKSIAKGWKSAGGVETEEQTGTPILAKSETPVQETELTAAIHFNADPRGKYYVTKDMHVLQVGNAGAEIIGRVSGSGDARYPLILQDGTGVRLYVHHSGAIVNRKGNIVGRLNEISKDS